MGNLGYPNLAKSCNCNAKANMQARLEEAGRSLHREEAFYDKLGVFMLRLLAVSILDIFSMCLFFGENTP